jgi:hypothetical protein
MGDEGENLAKRIVGEYHAYGIPAKAHRGMVLVHRDGELVGPFPAELMAQEYRAEIEGIKGRVRATLECHGVFEYLRNSGGGGYEEAYYKLMFTIEYMDDDRFSDLLRTQRAILKPLLADAEFAANPWYWTVAWVVVRELGQEGDGESPPE